MRYRKIVDNNCCQLFLNGAVCPVRKAHEKFLLTSISNSITIGNVVAVAARSPLQPSRETGITGPLFHM